MATFEAFNFVLKKWQRNWFIFNKLDKVNETVNEVNQDVFGRDSGL